MGVPKIVLVDVTEEDEKSKVLEFEDFQRIIIKQKILNER